MKNKIGKCIKMMIWIISSVIIGFLLNYYVTSEILINYFYGLSSLYSILTVVALIMQIIVIGEIIYVIYKRDCPRVIVILSMVLYVIMILILLFGRSNAERAINLNILELFSKDAFVHNLLNFIFFMPIGYVLRKKKWLYAIVFGVVLVTGIEIIQWITGRGIFDIVDIIIDSCAIILGYVIFRKKNIADV